MKAAAIIVAAGAGRRFGTRIPKQFMLLDGKPLFLWSILAFRKVREVRQIILVVPESRIPGLRRYRDAYRLELVPGGRERVDSVRSGLAKIGADIDLVTIHDAARPLLTPELVRKGLVAAARHGAAVTAVPCRDTVKLSRRGARVDVTVPRSELWLAQTPQTFRRSLLMRAYAALGAGGVTDDSQVAELAGKTVRIVPGDYRNIKVTERGDIRLAEFLLKEKR